MRLRADQLSSHLAGGKLAPIYQVAGDDPLLRGEAVDAIRAACRAAGCEERIRLGGPTGMDWNQLGAEAASLSLFASRRLLEIDMVGLKPGRDGGAALTAYAEQAGGDDILLLATAKVDKDMRKAKWFKAVEGAGALVQVWPVKAEELPGWLVRRARDYGIELERDAASFIATRVEGNLLAAAQELEKLALVSGGNRLDLRAAMGAVADSARYDVFGLVDQIAQGNSTQALRMLRGLRGEGTPIPVLTWALARELRTLVMLSEVQQAGGALGPAMRAARVFESREPLVRAMLRRHDGRALFEQLRAVAQLDRLMKLGAAERVWSQAEWLILAMTGGAGHPRMMSMMAESPLQ